MTNGLLAVNSLLWYLPLFFLLNKPFNSSAAFVFTSSLALFEWPLLLLPLLLELLF
jgi:hypothetical protein